MIGVSVEYQLVLALVRGSGNDSQYHTELALKMLVGKKKFKKFRKKYNWEHGVPM